MRLVIAGVAAGTLLAFVPVAHAAPEPTGFHCSFASVTDPTGEGAQAGEIDGGPLGLTDDTDPTATYTGTLTCTVQTGPDSRHQDPDAAWVTSSSGTVLAVAGTVTYEAFDDEPVYLCTQVDLTDGTTLYWDDWAEDWTTDSGAGCPVAISAPAQPPIDPTDLLVCPVVAVVFPPEGDIVLPDPIGKVWDCPPYDL